MVLIIYLKMLHNQHCHLKFDIIQMNTLKYFLLALISLTIVISVIVVICYFHIFSDGISYKSSDWNTFLTLFNGIVISILTSANVWVFFKLTSVIENNNSERAVKNRLFEAQSIITQMRVNAYNEILPILMDIVKDAHLLQFDMNKFVAFIKLIESNASSFLFCSNNIEEKSYLMKQTDEIAYFSAELIGISTLSKTQSEQLIKKIIKYRQLMESYIIGQLILDSDTERYIRNSDNVKSIDFSILNVSQLMQLSEEQHSQNNE